MQDGRVKYATPTLIRSKINKLLSIKTLVRVRVTCNWCGLNETRSRSLSEQTALLTTTSIIEAY